MGIKFCGVLIITVICVTCLSAQLNESFSLTTFPPDGWRILNADGGGTWQRNTVNYNTAPGCAACRYDDFNLTNNDWLVTPRLHVLTGDSLKFYYRTVDPVLESVEVRLSLKGPSVSDFTRILWAKRIIGTSYNLAKISLRNYIDSTVYLAFRYYVGYPLQPIGVGIYIDDVTGPQLYSSHDVGVSQIIAPIGVRIDSVVIPSSRVKNFGSFEETIPIAYKISSAYEAWDTIILLPGADSAVNFPSCTLSSGNYNTVSFTMLDGDVVPSNDTSESNFIIRTTNVWQTLTPFPKKVKATATSLCYSEDNFVYCLRASDTAFYAYDIAGNNWLQKKGTISKPKSGLGIVYGGNDTIYMLPRDKKKFYKYSVSGNAWVFADSLPAKPKSYTCLSRYGDYLYYLVGDTSFFRYSIPLNTWERIKGTPVKLKSGAALSEDAADYLYLLRGSKKEFYQYSISGNTWSIVESAPVKVKKGAALTSDGYNVYFLVSGRTKKFFKYNTVNKWQELDSVPLAVKGGGAITYALNKVYCLHGSSTTNFWAYIPSIPKIVLTKQDPPSQFENIMSITNTQSSDHIKSVSIYNAFGCLVSKLNINNFQISSLRNLPSGIYFVHTDTKSGTAEGRQKIIIIK
jgi:hypothetical protein